VRVRGESWRARCDEGVGAGEAVVVLAVSDLTLEVRRK
jgi:membrane protein implicated in regulation of membrane protease activity